MVIYMPFVIFVAQAYTHATALIHTENDRD